MKSTIHFLPALKKNYLLLFIAIPFFLATAFAVTPVSFFEKPSGETSPGSRDQRASSREADSGNASSIEPRGRSLTAAEPIERDSVARNEGINIISMIDDHDLLFEEELAQIDSVYRNSEEHSSVIATALHQPQINFSSPHHFASISSVATAVLVAPVVHRVDENTTLSIAAMHSSTYLKNLRSRLVLQYDPPADEHQLMENEETVNRAALADGVSPEELRVLRAQETCGFFLPAFKAAHKCTLSTFLHFHNLTRETTKIPPEVWGTYLAAVQNEKEIFESCQEAEQELEAAINTWKAKGGVSVVATAISNGEDSPR